MADISNVINLTLLTSPTLASYDNLNVVGIITSETGVLSTAERYRQYLNLAGVETDWGTQSQVYDHATAFFATNPNPINADGVLTVGWWRASDETVAASAATLTGAELSEATVIPQLQAISDGAFDIDVDGATENLTGMDFRVVTDLDEVATLIDSNLTGADCAANDDNQLVITSKTTGASSTLTYVSVPASGTFVGNILSLATGTGAVLVQGAASSVNSAESKVDAVTALQAQAGVRGVVFIDEPTGAEAQSLADYAQANNMLIYDVFDSASNLEIDVTNPVWLIKLSEEKRYRMFYSNTSNRKLATSHMARMHVVNFAGENTAITTHLKVLSQPAESFTETVIAKAKAVGLDIYTSIKLTPCLLASGANGFTDDEYNKLAIRDQFETDLYNLLKGTNTKIPQTTPGVNTIIDTCEATARRFVRCGVVAPGTWTSTDYFGDYDTFHRNIEESGFYFLAGRLSDQSQADRQARKSPVVQGALKFAGAIHTIDIIININL